MSQDKMSQDEMSQDKMSGGGLIGKINRNQNNEFVNFKIIDPKNLSTFGNSFAPRHIMQICINLFNHAKNFP